MSGKRILLDPSRRLRRGGPRRSVAIYRVAAFLVLCLGAPVVSGAQAAAEGEWPQWRGPLATGVSPAGHPPVTWSETQNVRWKVKIPGRGTATPIVTGDRVLIQTAIPAAKRPDAAQPRIEPGTPAPLAAPAQDGGGRPRGRGGPGMRSEKPVDPFQFALLSLDRRTGAVQWQRVLREEVPHEGHHPDHGFSSYSPVTDGERVIAHFGSRGIHCLDLNGNVKWSKDLGRMQTKMSFGEGSSPVLHGDTVVVNWDHEGEDFILALDKATGNELWRQPRDEETSWSTPLVVEHQGKAQVVTTATRKIRSYDLATGRLIWELGGLTANVIPSPVSQDGVVYATSGFRGNALFAIRLGREGDLTDSDAILWSHKKSTPYVPSPLLYGDKLYFLASNIGMISCFDAKKGSPFFEAERLEEVQGVYASPVGAANRIYVVGRNGVTAVLKNSDKVETLAINRLDDRFDASAAIAGDSLFLRGYEHLYCLAGE